MPTQQRNRKPARRPPQSRGSNRSSRTSSDRDGRAARLPSERSNAASRRSTTRTPALGEVGYRFTSIFPHGGLVKGRVTKIMRDGRRKCEYEDGDVEELTIDELAAISYTEGQSVVPSINHPFGRPVGLIGDLEQEATGDDGDAARDDDAVAVAGADGNVDTDDEDSEYSRDSSAAKPVAKGSLPPASSPISPTFNDVLDGARYDGKHNGNIFLRNHVQATCNSHGPGSAKGLVTPPSTQAIKSIIRSVHSKGGRFLKINKEKKWIVMPKNEVSEKVREMVQSFLHAKKDAGSKKSKEKAGNIIKKLRDHDIVHSFNHHFVKNGKAIKTKDHVGNVHSIMLASKYCQAYWNGIRDETVVDQYIQDVESLDPPGRFLNVVPSSSGGDSTFERIEKSEIRKKIKQKFKACKRGNKGGAVTADRVAVQLYDSDIKIDEKEMQLCPVQNHPGNSWILSKIEEHEKVANPNKSEIARRIFTEMQQEFPLIRFILEKQQKNQSKRYTLMTGKEAKKQIRSMLTIGDDQTDEEESSDDSMSDSSSVGTDDDQHSSGSETDNSDEESGSNSDDDSDADSTVLNEEGTIISKPHTHDVKGGRSNSNSDRTHDGNIYFYKVIDKYTPEYMDASNEQKKDVIECVIKSIESLQPPGRFLQPIADGKWQTMNKKAIFIKIRKRLYDSCVRGPNNVTYRLNDVKFVEMQLLEKDDHLEGNEWLKGKIQEYSSERHQHRKEKSVVREIMTAMAHEVFPPIRFIRPSKPQQWQVMSAQQVEEQISLLLQAYSGSKESKKRHRDGDESAINHRCEARRRGEKKAASITKKASKKRSRPEQHESPHRPAGKRGRKDAKRNNRIGEIIQYDNQVEMIPDDEQSDTEDMKEDARPHRRRLDSAIDDEDKDCIRKLRSMCEKGLISEEAKIRLQRNIIQKKLKRMGEDDFSFFEVAHRMLCFDDAGDEELAKHCEYAMKGDED